MRVLVTGAAGFLGQRVVLRLLQRGFQVRCLLRRIISNDVLATAFSEYRDSLEFVQGGLQAPPPGLADGCDAVIHAASIGTGSCSVLFLNNVVGTRKLLIEVERAAVKRFVHVSSLAVYQTTHLTPGAVLDESTPLEPTPHLRDYYTFSKVVQEQVICDAAATTGLSIVTVRPGVIYGPSRNPITPRVGLQIGPVFLRMGGRQPLPYTYVDNCADAVVLASMTAQVEGRTYNIVDDELPTGKQLIREFRNVVGPLRVVGLPRTFTPIFAAAMEWYSRKSRGQIPMALTRYRANAQWKPLSFRNNRAKLELNWSPKVSLKDGLRLTSSSFHIQSMQNGQVLEKPCERTK